MLQFNRMRFPLLSFVFCFSLISSTIFANDSHADARQIFELRVYHAASSQQVTSIENYLQLALIPALHHLGISKVGAFKSVENDTATDKKVYLLIPFSSLDAFANITSKLEKDVSYQQAGSDYLNAAYNQAPYKRFETILLKAFPGMPQLAAPLLNGPKQERIYELRSYEGPTEKLYENKVQMFNKGDEIGLFKRLGFNAVFYAEVLSGCHMPNLMYMTTFENRASREEHWKSFNDDPQWKKLVSAPEYQHNVSRADILFLTPEEFSDL